MLKYQVISLVTRTEMKGEEGVSLYLSKSQLNTKYAMILTRQMKASSICGQRVKETIAIKAKEKLIWIVKLDPLLSIVNSTWNKTITITGDTNVDQLKPSVALKGYKEVIETYNLKQYVTIPTRKRTKIIDHIMTNLQDNKLITTNVLPCPTMMDRIQKQISRG